MCMHDDHPFQSIPPELMLRGKPAIMGMDISAHTWERGHTISISHVTHTVFQYSHSISLLTTSVTGFVLKYIPTVSINLQCGAWFY